jgi:hypothetical protein
VPQIFLNEAPSILKDCDYLTAILMFSGYRISEDKVMLSQSQIYHNGQSKNRLSQMEQDRLSEITRSWTVDARFDLQSMS